MNLAPYVGLATGWICARCNTVNAPTTPWCYRCAPPFDAPKQSSGTGDVTGPMPTTTAQEQKP